MIEKKKDDSPTKTVVFPELLSHMDMYINITYTNNSMVVVRFNFPGIWTNHFFFFLTNVLVNHIQYRQQTTNNRDKRS